MTVNVKVSITFEVLFFNVCNRTIQSIKYKWWKFKSHNYVNLINCLQYICILEKWHDVWKSIWGIWYENF